MAKGIDLIKSSLRLIGALSSGEEPSGPEGAEALLVLNQLMGTWALERLMVHQIVSTDFTLVVNQQTYTIGASGGDFTLDPRPNRIERAGLLIDSGALELAVQILTFEQWHFIPVKGTTSDIPYNLYYEPAVTLGKIHLYPKPSVANQLRLYTWQDPPVFTLAGTVTVPPGYMRAIRYNLALDLAGEWAMPVSAAVAAIAVESKSAIKTHNHRPLDMACDEAIVGTSGGQFDYRTGERYRK